MSETIENQACIVIAIAGASASGKSLIASTIYKELKEELNSDDIGIISEDAYYKDQTHLTMEERVKTNYDHPNSMDHHLLVEHLRQLKQGEAIEIPEYDYSEHNRKTTTKNFTPKKIIILEGILLLTDEEIRNEINVSIFVDAPLDICFIRRLQRDMLERGRTMDSVIAQYRKTVRPMFLQFIEPSKQYADIIVPKGGKNRIAINILKAQLKQLLSKR
ncbi:uridine kinase [Actinobacillus pleuropneumoniae]|uniref:Uridine kinase n=3 Tax=Actinobacillus pleuropneumoniae TaxID=715 RepID=B3H1H1_ACTP7|nr:uridine kinase [Actinobacillus pleuropneumoniae]ACE61543.1 uridine kinase [Actinobacillus pleuropneumoniae serovar 7 str. AP76]EFL78459.1 uridine kinase [Actinobacillus pleuropneumoniae serovar 2 str. 4226]EFL80028.1 uridine kinase [Actinobacillus pleuropneumoniae serovar 6 str. Femo]EFM87790.1 Uridine kinase [Actinobacillus pleuropneumoniae serovar 2 str. S1536]EFM92067.1 Uridine kinase [Actinobacillus pleuropneumoniae serovar 6 str. Femo]